MNVINSIEIKKSKKYIIINIIWFLIFILAFITRFDYIKCIYIGVILAIFTHCMIYYRVLETRDKKLRNILCILSFLGAFLLLIASIIIAIAIQIYSFLTLALLIICMCSILTVIALRD